MTASRVERRIQHSSLDIARNVVSTLALMGYDHETCWIRLAATHPGVTVEDVIANTGFELIVPGHVGVNDPPSAEELRLLREETDPERFYI